MSKKKKRFLLAIIASAIFLAGCAKNKEFKNQNLPELKPIEETVPAIGGLHIDSEPSQEPSSREAKKGGDMNDIKSKLEKLKRENADVDLDIDESEFDIDDSDIDDKDIEEESEDEDIDDSDIDSL